MNQTNKLPPPIIERVLPACYGTELSVPFSMNKAVGLKEYDAMALKISTAQGNRYLTSLTTTNINNNKAHFDVSSQNLNIGQYYKVQLAYIKSEIYGFYSDIGVIKYTSQPEVIIETLEKDSINNHNYIYIGKYAQSDDVTEKVYSYCFNLYKNNKVIKSSGWLLHNSNLDEKENESFDLFEFSQELEQGEIYEIDYQIKTNNGLIISSSKYQIKQKTLIDSDYNIKIIPELNYNNAYIELKFKSQDLISGDFVVFKSDSKSDFKEWNKICGLNFNNDKADHFTFKDFDVAHGETYKYAIAQTNKYNLMTEKQISDSIKVSFEDMFLYDGNRQLKIRFNPKVSSFKNYIPEAKIETIGSKYPYFFRSGQVKYKEFSLAGLISHLSDEENLFFNVSSGSTDLSEKNLQDEKEFKLEVLDWLSNGQNKLFKSPAEGNYIVRLMNVGLSPIDSVSRMLHSFTCNAYEIADYNYQNLVNNNIVVVNTQTLDLYTCETIDLNHGIGENIIGKEVQMAYFEGIPADTQIMINDSIVTIGSTGAYEISDTINQISLDSGSWGENSILTIGYLKDYSSFFDAVVSIEDIDNIEENFEGAINIYEQLNPTSKETRVSYLNSGIFEVKNEATSDNFDDYKIILNGVEINIKDVKEQKYTINNLKINELVIGEEIKATLNYLQHNLTFEEVGE